MANPKERLIERTRRAQATGRTVVIMPAATAGELRDVESRCGPLPTQIQELFAHTSGFSVNGVEIDFRGEYPFEFDELFARSMPIAADGEGNFWVVDVSSSGEWGVVFFVAHDPPVVAVQARDLAAFVDQVFDASDASAMKQDDALLLIWERNPYVVSRAQALASSDLLLKAFAAEIPGTFAIADLRDAVPGQGFVWGSAGPNTDVRRAGEQLLFAIEQKKAGLFSRLFLR